MADIALGPEPGSKPHLTASQQSYLHLVRRKRLYSTILLVLLVALLATGFDLAETDKECFYGVSGGENLDFVEITHDYYLGILEARKLQESMN